MTPSPLATNRPVLVLSDSEKEWSWVLEQISPTPTPFALINYCGERDHSCDIFGPTIGQEVVGHYAKWIRFVQVVTSNELHTPSKNVTNLIGRTTIRDLARLAHWSRFGLGPVTLLQLVYAALSKPHLCMTGEREARSRVTFPSQIDLSARGMLPYCQSTSCWKSRVVPLNDGFTGDRSFCGMLVIMSRGETVPKWHQLVGSHGIIIAVVDRLIEGHSGTP